MGRKAVADVVEVRKLLKANPALSQVIWLGILASHAKRYT